MTKQEFLKQLDTAYREGYDYFSVLIQTEGVEGLELITNPMCRYEFKRKYYDNAYDENMALKLYSEIKIVCVDSFFGNCNIETLYKVMEE